jgi:hypothetical protein
VGQRDLLALLEDMVDLEIPDQLDIRENLAPLDPLDQRVRLDFMVILDQLE